MLTDVSAKTTPYCCPKNVNPAASVAHSSPVASEFVLRTYKEEPKEVNPVPPFATGTVFSAIFIVVVPEPLTSPDKVIVSLEVK